jgi:hypothetical protein
MAGREAKGGQRLRNEAETSRRKVADCRCFLGGLPPSQSSTPTFCAATAIVRKVTE